MTQIAALRCQLRSAAVDDAALEVEFESSTGAPQ